MELLFILHRLRCLHLYDGVAVVVVAIVFVAVAVVAVAVVAVAVVAVALVAVAVVAVAVVVVAVFPKKWIEKSAELFQILLLDFVRSNIESFNINQFQGWILSSSCPFCEGAE